MENTSSTLRILSLVEADTINAVAKNVLEFDRSAAELRQRDPAHPAVEDIVVTFERKADEEPNEFVRAAREMGIEVKVIPEKRRFDLSVIPALRDIAATSQPDLIVTHSVKSHFILWRSGLSQEFPWVAFHHGYTTTDRKMRVYNWVDRWSLPKADRVVTVCRAFAEDLAATTGVPVNEIAVQHNSIRPQPAVARDTVEALRGKLGIQDDEKVLLSVGRLSREKAHVDLLSAFAFLRESDPNLRCKLIIVGSGPEKETLEARTRSNDMAGSVILAGQQMDVRPFYSLADVFVLPSHSEGSPNVLLEAMSAGVPIVATAVGGVPEIVEHEKTALLVSKQDARALGTAIERVLDDAALAARLKTNAAALITDRFSSRNYVQMLIRIYRDVINQRTPVDVST